MTNRKTSKRALLASAVSLLLCVTMLIGTTFAWFTDSASSKGNKIMAGNLDVDLFLWDGDSYEDIGDSAAPIFGSYESDEAQNVNIDTLWEPGKTQVAYLKIKNNGNLALKYQVVLDTIDPADSNSLYEVMQYQIVPDAANGTGATWTPGAGKIAKLGKEIVSGDAAVEMMPEAEHNFALLIHMDENANNDYMNGKVEFDITVQATQLNAEADSFGTNYDKNAGNPVLVSTLDDLKTAIKNGGNVVLTEDIELTSTLMPTKDVVIDLDGNDITAPSSGNMFQSQSNAKPNITITSSTAGAEINVPGGNTSVLLGYGSTVINNVTINVESARSSSSAPFKVYGDLTLGEGTVVNVEYLGTSLINNNGANAIVIDGAKINVDTFKTNGSAMISLTSGATLALNNTEVKVCLDDITYTSYFISKAENATIGADCTFNVTGTSGKTYGIGFKPDSGAGARYVWVEK